MGWNAEGKTKIKCPRCDSYMDLLSGAWSEQPPDAFKLYCPQCHYEQELSTYEEVVEVLAVEGR